MNKLNEENNSQIFTTPPLYALISSIILIISTLGLILMIKDTKEIKLLILKFI